MKSREMTIAETKVSTVIKKPQHSKYKKIIISEFDDGNEALVDFIAILLEIRPDFDLELLIVKNGHLKVPYLNNIGNDILSSFLRYIEKGRTDDSLLSIMRGMKDDDSRIKIINDMIKEEICTHLVATKESMAIIMDSNDIDTIHEKLKSRYYMDKPDKVATHPSGATVSFNEKDHVYTSNGEVYISATTLIKENFPEFDRAGMAIGSARKQGREVSEVLMDWDNIVKAAVDHGNTVHKFIEDSLTGKKTNRDGLSTKTVEGLLELVRDIFGKYEMIEPEKMVFSPSLKNAGQMDLLAKKKGCDTYVILDWKTSKVIERENKYNKFGKGVFKSIPDNNFGHYSLQLSLYREILLREGYLPKETKIECFIIHIPVLGEGEYTEHQIQDYSKEIKALLNK
jgi:hypothetical protein